MPKRKPHPTLIPASHAGQPAPRKRSGLMRRVTHSALLAMSLKAAQFSGEDGLKQRIFDRGLLDRLTVPLTRYHE
jgi:hypothetical protein